MIVQNYMTRQSSHVSTALENEKKNKNKEKVQREGWAEKTEKKKKEEGRRKKKKGRRRRRAEKVNLYMTTWW